MIGLGHYLGSAAILFAIGLCGALSRKNAVIVLLGIEIMFNAANLNLIAFWRYGKDVVEATGQMFTLFSITIAGAEAAVGLALVIAIYRHYKSIDVEEITTLKG